MRCFDDQTFPLFGARTEKEKEIRSSELESKPALGCLRTEEARMNKVVINLI